MKRPATLANEHINAAYKIIRAEVKRRATKILEGKNATREFVMSNGTLAFFGEDGNEVSHLKCIEPLDNLITEFDGALHITGEGMYLKLQSGMVFDMIEVGG